MEIWIQEGNPGNPEIVPRRSLVVPRRSLVGVKGGETPYSSSLYIYIPPLPPLPPQVKPPILLNLPFKSYI